MNAKNLIFEHHRLADVATYRAARGFVEAHLGYYVSPWDATPSAGLWPTRNALLDLANRIEPADEERSE